MRGNPQRRLDGAPPVQRAGRVRAAVPAGGAFDEACRQHHADLVQAQIVAAAGRRLGQFTQHHQLGQGRQAAGLPDAAAPAQAIHQLRRNEEGQAGVAAAMVLMRAQVFIAGMADQHRPGHQLVGPAAVPVAEAAAPHVGDRIGLVQLHEGPLALRRLAAVVHHRHGALLQGGGDGHRAGLAPGVRA
jgi:hypothetical protein